MIGFVKDKFETIYMLIEWLLFRINWTLCLDSVRTESLFNGEYSFIKTIMNCCFTVVQFVSCLKGY